MMSVMQASTAARKVLDAMEAAPLVERGIAAEALGAAVLREGLRGAPKDYRDASGNLGGLSGALLFVAIGIGWLVITTPFGHPEAFMIGVLVLVLSGIATAYTISVALAGGRLMAEGRKQLVGQQLPNNRDQIARNAIAQMVALRWPDGSALVMRPFGGGVEIVHSVPPQAADQLGQLFGDRVAPLVAEPIKVVEPISAEPDGTRWADFPTDPQRSPAADSGLLPPPPVPRRGIISEPGSGSGAGTADWENYR
jgi:hypothetical protein